MVQRYKVLQAHGGEKITVSVHTMRLLLLWVELQEIVQDLKAPAPNKQVTPT